MKYEREYPELRVLNGELLLYEMIQFLLVLVLRTREEIMLGYDISNIFRWSYPSWKVYLQLILKLYPFMIHIYLKWIRNMYFTVHRMSQLHTYTHSHKSTHHGIKLKHAYKEFNITGKSYSSGYMLLWLVFRQYSPW